MMTKVEEKFSDFFEKWVSQLEELLQQLVQVSKTTNNDSDQVQALVTRVTTHVKAYYTEKWAAAHEDVLAFFSPVWLSPLENAYQWVTGWKPSTVFRMVESLRKSGRSTMLRSLTEQQVKMVEDLRLKIRLEEEKVEREMERQQVAMADRRMVELARLASRGGGGGSGEAAEEGLVEATLKGMFVGLERVMKAADCVRLKTLKGVLEELSPLQSVEFLAATCMLQLQLRQLGRKRSGGGGTNDATTTTACY